MTTVPTADTRDIFTPGSPVKVSDLFYGRRSQLDRVRDAVPSPGRHPIIFGQRGVGKTSLAYVASLLLPSDHYVVHLTCVEDDSFKTIWRRALRQVAVTVDEPAMGLVPRTVGRPATLHDWLPADNGVGPADVAEAIRAYPGPLVFILDEFDRVTDPAAKGGTADLLKTLSDNSPHATLVLVGVGQSIRDLIGQHPSVERNLVQIEMPKMTDSEIEGLVRSGCERLGIQVEPAVLREVAKLADGFPYYAHLLGASIARTARQVRATAIDSRLFREVVCPMAIEDSIDSYRLAFANATSTANASRHPRVLCACAFAACNDHGRFKTGDVSEALAKVFNEEVKPHSIKGVLGSFASTARGDVLSRHRQGSVNFYEFREPMMRPFLRIKAQTLLADR